MIIGPAGEGNRQFDAMLDRTPELRFRRRLSASYLRRHHGRQRGECTWCGAAVPKGCRTWCDQACVKLFRLRCDPGFAARMVVRRDKGICRTCGRDCRKCLRVYRHAMRDGWRYGLDQSQFRHDVERVLGLSKWGDKSHEVDHEIPVSEGGGLCLPSGLRLLCCGCHNEESARLAARLAEQRRKSA